MSVTNHPTLQEGRVYALPGANSPCLGLSPSAHLPAQVDLVVVGAGLAGCSAALEASRRGLRVVVLEAGAVGEGQAGRCGGQIIPGFEVPAPTLLKKHGPTLARALMQQSLAASRHLQGVLQGCPALATQDGGLVLGSTPADIEYLREEQAALAQMGLESRFLDTKLADFIGSPLYRAGLFMPNTWHTNPLRACQFLMKQAQALGARLFQYTPALGLARHGSQWVVSTACGEARAPQVFLAGGDTVLLRYRAFAPTVTLRTWQLATQVLSPSVQAAILPSGACAYDVQDLTMDYFRLDGGRLLLGGGDAIARKGMRGVDYLKNRIANIFPQLGGVGLEYFWHGDFDVSASRMPVLRAENGLYVACGYSGHGTVNAYGAGRWAVQAMLGEPKAWKLFTLGRALHFPAHHRLRTMAGSLGAVVLRAFA